MIRTSIVVLTKNEGKWLDGVLESVYSQTLADELEVIHIDSGSTDATLAISARYPTRLVQIQPHEFSHSATRNLGASLARGEYVVYLSGDATPIGPRWLESLIAPLGDPTVAGVYGRQVPRPGGDVVEAYFLERTYDEMPRAKCLPPNGRLALADLFFSNVTSAIRRSVWERFPYDERLQLSEDQNFSRNALRAGYSLVYQPKAAVWHSNHYSFASLFRRNFDSGSSLSVLLEGEDIGFLGYGASYLAREVVDFARKGHWRHLPHLALYEAVRASGFFLGRNFRRLPRGVCRACSGFKAHWDRLDPSATGGLRPAPADSGR